MPYTFGIRDALGIARCCIGQGRSASWLPVFYVALVRASAFLSCLAADTIAVDVLIEEFLALAAVDCLAHCSVPFFNSLISPSAAATI